MNGLHRIWADFRSDIRYGFRDLFRHPKFSTIAILILALGMGLTTAVLSIFYDVLLRPLPYTHAERLVTLWGREQRTANVPASGPDFLDWKTQNRVFEQIAGYSNFRNFIFSTGGTPLHVRGTVVSPEFFSLLGVPTAMGRDFLPDEEQKTHSRVALISYRFWQQQFGGAEVLGKPINLDNNSFTIIGVLEKQFWFPHMDDVDVWVPLNSDPANIGTGSSITKRDSHWIKVVARLKPGVSLQQSREDMQRIASALARDYPQTNYGLSMEIRPLYEDAVGNLRVLLLILQGAVSLVLLVACFNVAGLLLARFIERQREVATRLILGAERWRISRQFLTETIVLCFCGGLLGLPLAYGVLSLFHFLEVENTSIAAQGSLVVLGGGSVDLSRSLQSTLDWHVLAFVVLAIVAAACVCSLAPLFLMFRAKPIEVIKSGGRTSSSRLTVRLRTGLVISEVAIATVLLVSAGLLVRSLFKLNSAGSGFDVRQVLTAQIQVSRSRYSSPEQLVRFYDQFLTQTRGIPGVVSAGLIDFLPFTGLHNNAPFLSEGSTESDLWKGPLSEYRVVSPNYFQTLEVPLIAGRDFGPNDSENKPRTVIVSRNLAQQFLGGVQQAVGKRLHVTFAPNEWVQVIGVVGDVKHWNVGEEPSRYIYFPILQWEPRTFFAVVRASTNLDSLAPVLKSELPETAADQVMYDIKPMAQRYAESFAPYRMNLFAVGSFAAVTLVLACVGLYGVISFTIAQRTREIGIRVALGAQPRQVLALVMKLCWTLTLAGLVLGAILAVGTDRFLNRFLYNVGQVDPVTFSVVGAMIALLAGAAGYFAARRALTIEAAEVLRQD